MGVIQGVLLDTHALVWAVSDPIRLGAEARKLLENPATAVYVSAASAWEIATKVRLGRFPEAEIVSDQFDEIVTRLRAEPLPITAKHALRAGRLDWKHRDPFDRILAAQTMLSGLTLLTRDQALRDLSGL